MNTRYRRRLRRPPGCVSTRRLRRSFPSCNTTTQLDPIELLVQEPGGQPALLHCTHGKAPLPVLLLLGAAAALLTLRPLLVALIALVLTLAGWRPRPTCWLSTGASAPLLMTKGAEAPVVRRFEVRAVPAYASPTVEQLRRQVRALHGSSWRSPAGRRPAQATRAQLMEAMA